MYIYRYRYEHIHNINNIRPHFCIICDPILGIESSCTPTFKKKKFFIIFFVEVKHMVSFMYWYPKIFKLIC